MDWKPITRGKPEVKGVNSEYSGLLDVAIPLEGDIDINWSQFFENPVGVPIPLSMHPPKLTGRTVYIRPSDEEVEAYVKHVDERIAAANARFQTEVLPKIQQMEQRDRADREERQRRIEDARRRLENL